MPLLRSKDISRYDSRLRTHGFTCGTLDFPILNNVMHIQIEQYTVLLRKSLSQSVVYDKYGGIAYIRSKLITI